MYVGGERWELAEAGEVGGAGYPITLATVLFFSLCRTYTHFLQQALRCILRDMYM